ncbi:MAG: glycosyltransferase family 4 protein [bacterium]|nr:glycosyltransferase family 4 protein [bacterium]
MHVVHLIKVTGIAGAERHLLTLLPGLRAAGTDARLIALVEPGHPVDALAHAAAQVGVPFERAIIHHHGDVGLIRRLIPLLRRERPDIVHTHLLHADLYGIPAAKLAGVRRVVTSRHNDDAFRRQPHWRAIHAAQWRMVDQGIAISDAIRAFSIAVESAPPSKITRIHYGLPSAPPAAPPDLRAALGIPPGTPLIGMVGRVTAQKGMRYGLIGFLQAADTFPDAHLVIVGDGDERAALESLVADRMDAKNVHFLGWRADAAALMGAFDVFLMPSLWEGFGLVLLEAMAAGKPVIASRASAIPEIVVDGATGLLVPPRDPDAITAALRHLLADAGLRAQMGAAGAARLREHFTPDGMIAATQALYDRILTSGR